MSDITVFNPDHELDYIEELEKHAAENLPDQTAVPLIEEFFPFVEKIAEVAQAAKDIRVDSIDQVDEMHQAKRLRLILRSNRTSGEDLRKKLGKDALDYKRAVDAVGRVVRESSEAIEAYLSDQETYAERLETERLDKLEGERRMIVSELIPPEVSLGSYNLRDMDDVQFGQLVDMLRGAKKQREEDAVRKTEEERLERERLAALDEENKRLAAEAERLKRERDNEIENLKIERLEKLSEYQLDGEHYDWPRDLGEMSEPDFLKLLDATRIAYEQDTRHEKRAEILSRYKYPGSDLFDRDLGEMGETEFHELAELAEKEFEGWKRRIERIRANATPLSGSFSDYIDNEFFLSLKSHEELNVIEDEIEEIRMSELRPFLEDEDEFEIDGVTRSTIGLIRHEYFLRVLDIARRKKEAADLSTIETLGELILILVSPDLQPHSYVGFPGGLYADIIRLTADHMFGGFPEIDEEPEEDDTVDPYQLKSFDDDSVIEPNLRTRGEED